MREREIYISIIVFIQLVPDVSEWVGIDQHHIRALSGSYHHYLSTHRSSWSSPRRLFAQSDRSGQCDASRTWAEKGSALLVGVGDAWCWPSISWDTTKSIKIEIGINSKDSIYVYFCARFCDKEPTWKPRWCLVSKLWSDWWQDFAFCTPIHPSTTRNSRLVGTS